jgi:EAL domain-containing protein (putative c-di-GMP-specific phosphodiesterase class I)
MMVDSPTIADVVSNRLVRSVYQPIVSIHDGSIIGVEALARGPVGTLLEAPLALFDAARQAGLEHQLEWLCRTAAIQGALDGGLPTDVQLFVNAEPSSFAARPPSSLDEITRQGIEELSIVVEVTERDLTSNPASLIRALHWIRSLGFGIAVDDVGADPSSLAFLPFMEPDVIKLDMSLVHAPAGEHTAAVAAAVSAAAERHGAWVLAEGIETDVHRRRAMALGADLAQGWLFGYPEPLANVLDRADVKVRTRSLSWADPMPVVESPWTLVADSPRRRRTTKSLLLPMSDHVERGAALGGSPAVLLGAFQHARHFTARTAQRYEQLANDCSFVAAIGEGMAPDPATGVRGAALPDRHPLRGEWAVTVVGPHYAAALIARDLGDTGPDADRRFDYVITHDRDLVIAAARSLMQHIV